MHKSILVFVFLLFNICKAGEPDKNLHEKCLYPTVLVWSDTHTGTGVVVQSTKIGEKQYRNTVFSAAHVFKEVLYQGETKPRIPPYRVYVPKYKNWSTLYQYDEFTATIRRIDRNTDAAVLTFDSEFLVKVADIDWSPKLYIGNTVTHIGGGLGQELRVDHGEITSIRVSSGDGFPKGMYRTNVFTLPGDSGGPLFHENKVVGICQSIRTRMWTINKEYIDVPIHKYSMYISIPLSFTLQDLKY